MTTLTPNDVFTIAQYPYVRFVFGTDRAYRARYNDPPGEPGTPWAFRDAAVLSATPIARPIIAANLALGAVVSVPDYGTFRIDRDHNQNVKFTAI